MTTHSGVMTDPPHKWQPWNCRLACQGHCASEDEFPPTMRGLEPVLRPQAAEGERMVGRVPGEGEGAGHLRQGMGRVLRGAVGTAR